MTSVTSLQIHLYWHIYGKRDRVLCFYYSRMHIANDMNHVRTHVRTNRPTYAFSTIFHHSSAETNKKKAWIACIWVSHNSTYLHVCNYLMVQLQSHQLNLIFWVYSHQTWLTHWKCNGQKLWIVLSQYWMTVQSRYSKPKYYLSWNTYNSGV